MISMQSHIHRAPAVERNGGSAPLREDYREVWGNMLHAMDPAALLAHHRETRSTFLECLRELAASLPAGGSVAELGCGTAVDSALLAAEFPSLRFMAADISPQAVAIAVKCAAAANADLAVLVADIFSLPFPNNRVDMIFSQGVMEHFADPMPSLREQARALRHGGFIVVNVPQTFTGYTLHKKRKIAAGEWKLGWETSYSSGDMKRFGRKLGLVVERVFGCSYWPSRREPVFVLRDLAGKARRRLPRAALKFLSPALDAYDSAWKILERHAGHVFMQNIVAIYRKP